MIVMAENQSNHVDVSIFQFLPHLVFSLARMRKRFVISYDSCKARVQLFALTVDQWPDWP